MKNIKLIISYDGTNFYGWQTQPGKRTVQATIEQTIEDTFHEKVMLQGASRTDAYVHAKGQVANFKLLRAIPVAKIKIALNSKLPKDIVIISAEIVDDAFNARFEAKGKHYQYIIFSDWLHSPFERNYSYFCHYVLDLIKMREAAAFMLGTMDFASFGVNPRRDIKSTIKTISRIDISSFPQEVGTKIVIDIVGNSFLYKMIRSMVGTLIEVGRGKKEPHMVVDILKKKDRIYADKTVPGAGLYLLEVYY